MNTPAPPGRTRARGFRNLALRWGLIYIGIVAVFSFLERALVFRPSSPAESWYDPVEPDTSEFTFPSADGSTIHAWWVPPRDPGAGAVLVSHGNGGNLSHRGRIAAELRKSLSAGVLLYDYPGYGKSQGKPTEESCYAAGEAAYRRLTEEQKIPANRIVLFGESLGGGPAVELAVRHDHRALVLMFPFTSLPAAAKYHYPFLPTGTLMRTRFDNLSKIGRCLRPVFIAHGTADRVIPISQGEELFAAANPPKEFLRFEGAGHDMTMIQGMTGPLAKFLEGK
jgi:fermentation-respiration switch protein FrsA (DUF1100 family)